MSKQLTVVGKSSSRYDALDKVTGSAKYTTDIKLPGMLYGKILGSPHPHAEIINIDTRQAARISGVKAIVTYENSPQISYGVIPPPGAQDYRILEKRVRYVGDRVAAVAATSEEAAEEALGLIKVKYKLLPSVFDPQEALKPDAPKLHSPESNMAGQDTFKIGDIEDGYSEADCVFENRYETSVVQTCTLEPHVCVADSSPAGLTVWHSTQDIFGDRHVLATLFDLPLNKVRVIAPPLGGGFGNKTADVVMCVAALLARKAGNPVRIECTREEEFISRTRHPFRIKLKTGIGKNGIITARDIEVLGSTGAHADWGPSVLRWMMLNFFMMYKCPNISYRGRVVYTNMPVAGAFRGFGVPQMAFAVESQMDEIAEEIDIDPIRLRLINSFRKGDQTGIGVLMTSCGLEECLEMGSKKIGWHKARKKGVSGKIRHGMGMACATYLTGLGKPYNAAPDVGSAIVQVNEDGTATLQVTNPELGTGTHTIEAQIVAEELGLRLEDVKVCVPDTDSSPYGFGTGGSSRTIAQGNAVIRATQQAKDQLLSKAADILDRTVDELEIADGKIYSSQSKGRTVTVSDVVKSTYLSPGSAIIGVASYAPKQQLPVSVAIFAEVDVDIETGKTHVSRLAIAEDVGKALNPANIEGQIQGGIQQGIGYALTEELLFDKEGRALNPNFLDYKLVGAAEMPEIDITLVESNDPLGPYGAKGAGEVPLLVVAPAIANAIYDATGARINRIPITAERLFQARLACERPL